MTEEIKLWEGDFGDKYQERNVVTKEEIDIRQNFWENLLRIIYQNSGTLPKSILEVGAGQGPNLAALQNIYDNMYKMAVEAKKDVKIPKLDVTYWATEVNQKAQEQLKTNVENINILPTIRGTKNIADLVFTYGVLIHTHPAQLKGLLEDIHGASKRWIVACEYFAPETRAISYHGKDQALWLDDYGSKYLDNFKLKVIGHGFCWKRMTKLDDITFWLFEKAEKLH